MALIILLMVIFFCPTVSFGENPALPVLKLSLSQTIELALKNGRDIKIAKEDLQNSKAQKGLTLSEFTPKTEVIVSTDRGFNKTSDSIEDEQGYRSSFTDTNSSEYRWRMDKLPSETLGGRVSTRIGIGLNRVNNRISGKSNEKYFSDPSVSLSYKQPLTRAGRISGYSSILRVADDWNLAKLNYARTEKLIIFEVVQNYYNLIKSEKLVSFLEENLKQTEKQLEAAKVQLRLGVIAEIEILKMKVQFAQERSNLIDAQRGLTAKQEYLAILIGEPFLSKIIPTTIPLYSFKSINKNECLHTALQEREELKELGYLKNLLYTDLARARSTDDPFLLFNGNYKRKGEAKHFKSVFDNFKQEDWSIGIRVTIPIDDHGVTSNRTDRVFAGLSKLKNRRNKIKDGIIFEVNESIRNLDSFKRRFDILKEAVDIATENLKIDQLRFNRGVISSDDLGRTQNALLQLKVDRFNTLIDYKIAETALKKAMGTLNRESF